MRWYLVKVKQLVPDDQLSKSDDRLDNPAGTYEVEGVDEDNALDEFHGTHAIGCLDDFSITIEEIE